MSLNIISISVICSGFNVEKLDAGKKENLNISLVNIGQLNAYQEMKKHEVDKNYAMKLLFCLKKQKNKKTKKRNDNCFTDSISFNMVNFLFLLVFPAFSDRKRFFIGN
ncbi:hypothetical protein [Photorhabdus namnaonensis]|uniref:hypothetical protein n=1 Tax=Photorhabdus namnaonensis TaxID=1851568 RepID=UPI0008084681|nr:hypothetical protein [Photorhabdus namnaonensis]